LTKKKPNKGDKNPPSDEQVDAYLLRERQKIVIKPHARVGGDRRPKEIIDDILAQASEGKLTPHQAEDKAISHGFPRLTREPRHEDHNPFNLTAWTLPMVLAWAVLRDQETVMWHDDSFRSECSEWQRDAKGWILAQPAPATMVLTEMGITEDARAGADFGSRCDAVLNAKRELWKNLSLGVIEATAVRTTDGSVTTIPASDWPRLRLAEDRHDYLRYDHAPLGRAYTNILLPTSAVLKLWAPMAAAVKRADAVTECTAWISAIMAASPTEQTMLRDVFLDDAGKKYRLPRTKLIEIWTSCSRQYKAWRKSGPRNGPRKNARENVISARRQ
jgi:hypothetical protein